MKLLKTIQLKCGQTYLMRTDDGNILEVGDVFMSVEKENVIITIHAMED